MADISPHMQKYYNRLNTGLARAMEVAGEARKAGLDPETVIEIPIANDLADRVEAQVGIKGVAACIRDLESRMSREEASLKIGDVFVSRKFGETDNDQILDHTIRTSMALVTEGVVSAPIEGIAKVAVRKNDDGTEYLSIYYAGPIRSAGGTAQALSVLVGDYVRRLLGLSRYIPRPEEIERYVEEIRQYNSIMSLQYLPSPEEIRLIIQNCPVCIDGEPTEREEVSGYRNLERVETNTVRGGMALVIAEGLILKAPKVMRNVRKMKMDGWDWLEELMHSTTSSSTDHEEKEVGIHPKDKYLRDLIGGRPVFAYPMRKGGFRLVYGRSRNTGLAAGGLHPATLHILGDFLAVGTQMKTERPGKAAGISPVDSIQGPTVRLINGDVLRIDDAKQARELSPQVASIIDVGEILISYGEFMENNHVLAPCAYCEAWWHLEGGVGHPTSEEEALACCEAGAFLHPDFTLLWDDVRPEEIRELAVYISQHGSLSENTLKIPQDPVIKEILENILCPHLVRDEVILISPANLFCRCLGLDENLAMISAWDGEKTDSLDLIMHLSGLKLRSKAGTRIGGRMGRPGKAKPREMKPAPHVLFPVGEGGGSRRSLQEAGRHTYKANTDGGILQLEMGVRRCPACKTETYLNRCSCGTHTVPVIACPRCGIEVGDGTCPQCGVPGACNREYTINVKQQYLKALENLGVREQTGDLVKGVKGLVSRLKPVEMLEKGVLRSLNNLFVFKDGTVRFDIIDMPLTHFRPREIGVPVERLVDLGYTHDIYGKELTDREQILELPPQDILVPEVCGDYLLACTKFIDQLLVKVYGLEPFYNCEKRLDLIGHLIIGLAPHTSAGVLVRLIGFSKANVGYGHPFFHAAKRRNCFFGDTLIEIGDETGIHAVPIRQFVLERLDLSQAGVDNIGTFYADPTRPAYARTVDTGGIPHIRKVTSISVHRSPQNLIQFVTARGKKLMVTPDHAMLVWDVDYLRKIRALEVKVGDAVPVWEGSVVISDRIATIDYVQSPDERVYCLTVDRDHSVVANGIFTGQCDGDEDCVMLLLDGLINFSRAFLPETRGGSMDAPLVLSSRIDPTEIDKESHNLDVCAGYPLELYLKALEYAHPKDVEGLIDRVEKRLGKENQIEGFFFTHDTSDISAGPLDTMYTQLQSMVDKLNCELELAKKIKAVDEHDVAERVLQTHFIRDLQGNLGAFAKQKFRCTKCNTSYRRMPLSGKCRCGGTVIPTVHEGSVKKYLKMSQEICEEFHISEYTRQRVEVINMNIESTFGEEKIEQLGLADFM